MADDTTANPDATNVDYSDLLRRVASYFGGAASANRTQNNLNDQRKQSQWKEQADAQLGRDRFAESAPATRMATSMRASMANNFSPTKIKWGGPGSGLRGEIPEYSGGAAGALAHLDPRTRQLNDTVMGDELLSQQKGGASGGGGDRYLRNPPPIGASSTGDKLLGGAAAGSGLLSALTGGGAPGSGGTDLSKIADLFRHHKDYDPWSDPNNYDENGQYIGEGAYDQNGDYVGGGDDPFAAADGNSADGAGGGTGEEWPPDGSGWGGE